MTKLELVTLRALCFARKYSRRNFGVLASNSPLWDGCDDAQMGEGVNAEPDWDEAAQLVPDFEEDQRVSW